MGIKQENEITMKVNCEIKELCRILEDKGFKVIDKFTMNDIFMIPNTLKTKIKELTSREILQDAILIRNIENQFKGNRCVYLILKKAQNDLFDLNILPFLPNLSIIKIGNGETTNVVCQFSM